MKMLLHEGGIGGGDERGTGGDLHLLLIAIPIPNNKMMIRIVQPPAMDPPMMICS